MNLLTRGAALVSSVPLPITLFLSLSSLSLCCLSADNNKLKAYFQGLPKRNRVGRRRIRKLPKRTVYCVYVSVCASVRVCVHCVYATCVGPLWDRELSRLWAKTNVASELHGIARWVCACVRVCVYACVCACVCARCVCWLPAGLIVSRETGLKPICNCKCKGVRAHRCTLTHKHTHT